MTDPEGRIQPYWSPQSQAPGKEAKLCKVCFQFLLLCLFLFSSFSPESWGQIRISKLLFPSALGPLPDSSPSCGSTAADSLAELSHLDLEESDTLCIASSSCRQDFRTLSQCPGRLRGSLTPKKIQRCLPESATCEGSQRSGTLPPGVFAFGILCYFPLF